MSKNPKTGGKGGGLAQFSSKGRTQTIQKNKGKEHDKGVNADLNRSNNFDRTIMNESESRIWRIKYRPRTLDDLAKFRPKLAKVIGGYVENNDFPHIMLVGPKGSGKTVVAEILAREILGSEFEMNFKLLFANDTIGKSEREQARRESYVSTSRIGSGAGIQKNFRPFIQIRVRPFVSTRKFGNAPFKILAIENFHELDVEQQAFRRIMERYSANCRMILITDRISGIIDPIISRCQIVMVPFIDEINFNRFFKYVSKMEGFTIKLNELNYIRYIANNNIGKALDLVQITYLENGKITLDALSKVDDKINVKLIEKLFNSTFTGNLKNVRATLREVFTKKKFGKSELLSGLMDVILRAPIERVIKSQYIELISRSDFESIDSTDDEIQIQKLLFQMSLIGKEVKK